MSGRDYAVGVPSACPPPGDCGAGAGTDTPLSRVFTVLGKRWSGLLLGVLMGGPRRYAELSRAVPQVSDRMLSSRLSELEGAGLVVREVRPGPPVAVVYGLTEQGEDLRAALDELRGWAERNPDVRVE